ncbi:MAG: hypothetical protein ABJF89_07660 [Parasphingorhabdus sp.]|uniref:hypothetical protein n=3 Tax=Parasphingorhabdus sp. TaxID=2709688 RepID=UPI003263E33D
MLSQPNLSEMPVGQLIRWGSLFDHAPATIRVTAGRLMKQGLLESTDRGIYRIGQVGKALQETAAAWISILDRIGAWDGQWLCVHTSHLGRTDKTAVRTRERAFRLMGFEQLVAGLWCRPANLVEPASVSLNRLIALGLERGAVLLHMQGADMCADVDAHRLWLREPREDQYRKMIGLLEASQQRLAHLDLGSAMQESFLVGEHVIRQINADPLLPEEMIDTALRMQMISTMQSYDAHCHPLWVAFRDHYQNNQASD